MLLVTLTPMESEIDHYDLTNRVNISFTPVRNEADCTVHPG